MTADTPISQRDSLRLPRGWFVVVCAAGLIVLAGCKHNKEAKGTGVSRRQRSPHRRAESDSQAKCTDPRPRHRSLWSFGSPGHSHRRQAR